MREHDSGLSTVLVAIVRLSFVDHKESKYNSHLIKIFQSLSFAFFYSTKYSGDIERKSAAASKAPALLR